MVSIMPGMDMAEPERTETSSGFSAEPKPLPVFVSSSAICLLHVVHDAVGQAVVFEEGEAGLGGDDEAGRDVETDLRHFAKVRTLAAEQHLVLAVAFFEGKDHLAFGHLTLLF